MFLVEFILIKFFFVYSSDLLLNCNVIWPAYIFFFFFQEGLLEEGDDFPDFRMKVSELIKDVVFIVGSSNCFRQMFLSIQTQETTWDNIEAALFIMQAVAKNVLP